MNFCFDLQSTTTFKFGLFFKYEFYHTWANKSSLYSQVVNLVLDRLECYFTPVFFLLLDKKAYYYAEKQVRLTLRSIKEAIHTL